MFLNNIKLQISLKNCLAITYIGTYIRTYVTKSRKFQNTVSKKSLLRKKQQKWEEVFVKHYEGTNAWSTDGKMKKYGTVVTPNLMCAVETIAGTKRNKQNINKIDERRKR